MVRETQLNSTPIFHAKHSERIPSRKNEFYKSGDQDDMEILLKLQKATMTISDDMLYTLKVWAKNNDVKCVQSLFEADAGLQHLENTGITDGTFSEDGNFFPFNS
jgi:hypothetical protein